MGGGENHAVETGQSIFWEGKIIGQTENSVLRLVVIFVLYNDFSFIF